MLDIFYYFQFIKGKTQSFGESEFYYIFEINFYLSLCFEFNEQQNAILVVEMDKSVSQTFFKLNEIRIRNSTLFRASKIVRQ